MAHLIMENDNMFSVKQKPWHGLGTVVETAPTIEEGIKLANLDWTVDLKEVAVDGNIVKGYKAAMRSDTNTCLGVVSDQYKILQNTEAFEFFQPFLDTEVASLETAGSLKNGKRVWVLAKINRDDMIIDKNDRVEKYILLSNSHDGTAAIKVGYCPIRVVCNNTLSAAEDSVNSQLIRVTHRGDIHATLDMVRDTMHVIDASFKTTEEMYKALAQKDNIKTEDIKKYVMAVYSRQDLKKNFEDNTAITEEEISAARKKLISRVEELFEMEYAHNAWTMYNSVNYVLNHERGRNLESSYNSIWFESAKRLDREALKIALTY
ncbi:MAG: DUF932 domain-containing protein [Clostridia bacterium]|nr:DUF932 domain-containing protein [Clostridia bacterium]